MATKLLLISLLSLLSLLSLSSSLSSEIVLDAAEILSNSGFISMSLTLQLLSQTTLIITSQSHSLTVFSPSDHAFALSGQPPLSLLQLHFSPLSLSLQSLKSLPQYSIIPTLSPNHSLILTSSPYDDFVSLNGVKINESPLYDDKSLIIFGTEEFFDPNFRVLIRANESHSSNSNLGCVLSSSSSSSSVNGSGYSFEKACRVLKSRGYSVMASFLDLQVMGFKNQNQSLLTLFAPVDDTMVDFVGNFSQYSSMFFRHLVPCKIEWSDLVSFDDGTMLETYLKGFKINVTRSGDVVMVNDVPVMFPDMYNGEGVVIHGLDKVLVVPERPQEVAESSSESGDDSEGNGPDNGEF